MGGEVYRAHFGGKGEGELYACRMAWEQRADQITEFACSWGLSGAAKRAGALSAYSSLEEDNPQTIV